MEHQQNFKGVWFGASYGAGLNQFKSSGVTAGSSATAKHSALATIQLVEDFPYLAAHVEDSQLPQEIESAHPLLMSELISVSVFSVLSAAFEHS